MPNYFANPNADISAFAGAGNAVADVLAKLPAIRQQQAMEMLGLQLKQQQLAGEAPLWQAHASELGAQGRHYDAQVEQIKSLVADQVLNRKFVQDAANSQRFSVTGGVAETPQIQAQADQDAAAIASAYLNHRPDLGAKAIVQNSANEKLRNPSTLQAMEITTGQHPVVNMPAGGTLVDTSAPPGSPPLAASPRSLNAGDILTGPQGGPALATAPFKPDASKDPRVGTYPAVLNTYAKGMRVPPKVLQTVWDFIESLGQNTVAPKPTAPGATNAPISFKSADEVKKAVADGKLGAEEAKKVLREKFGFQ